MKKIISFLLSAALMCAVVGMLGMTAGAAKSQTSVTSWNYVQEFDSLPESGFRYMKGNNNDCESGDIGIGVSGSSFVFENREKVEYIVEMRDSAVSKCDAYIFEVKFKVEYESGITPVITFQNYMGNNFRIQSQLTPTLWRLRTAANEWNDVSVSVFDGEWHTIRYEVKISDGQGLCDRYLDGTCVSEGTTMHGNNGAALIKVINNANNDSGKLTKLTIDYIKATPTPEQTEPDSGTQSAGTDPEETSAPETTKKPVRDSEKYQRSSLPIRRRSSPEDGNSDLLGPRPRDR